MRDVVHLLRRRAQPIVFCLIFAIGWGGVSWLVVEKYSASRLASELDEETRALTVATETSRATLSAYFSRVSGFPRVIAGDHEVLKAVSSAVGKTRPPTWSNEQYREELNTEPAIQAVGRRLQSILIDLGVDQILLFNANGDCISAAGLSPNLATQGRNFGDRVYFQQAKTTGSGLQYAYGRLSGVPGFYFSRSIRIADEFMGVVAIKIEESRMAWRLANQTAFVTDANGVVILASDPRFLEKQTPEARLNLLPQTKREQFYGDKTFEELKLSHTSVFNMRLTQLEGQPRPLLENFAELPMEMTLWMFRDVEELWRVRTERFILLGLVFLIGVLSLLFFRSEGQWRSFRRSLNPELTRNNSELAALSTELLLESRNDSLTGCHNRRSFDEAVAIEVHRSERFNLACSLLYLDLDHFNEMNDRFGPAAGDEVLRAFAVAVGLGLRATDFLARSRADQFLLLLPQTPLEGALLVAERLRKETEELAIPFKNLPDLRITVSIGVSQWRGAAKGDSTTQWLERVEQAMRSAKQQGHNRVCSEPTSHAGPVLG